MLNPKFHRRIKYINVRYYWIREIVEIKQIDVIYVSIKNIIANKFTKPLASQAFENFLLMIDIADILGQKIAV